MPFSIAVTLSDGEMTPRQLAAKRLRDPAVHELASRVKVVESEAMNQRYPREWPLEIAVTLNDGRILTHRLDNVKWSPRRPPVWSEMVAKFIRMAEPVIGTKRSAKVVEFVADVQAAPSVMPLMELLKP